MAASPKPPNPGSPEAVAQGCTCPVIDNHHGDGADGKGGEFWVHSNCPLHITKWEQPTNE